ncbi:MAG: O-antigen ligase family protein [Thermoanaerobaculia bacterium]
MILLLFLAGIPFPYGAVTPAGALILHLSSFAIGALTFLSMPRKPRIGATVVPLTALFLLAILGAFQLMPLSMSTLRSIAPLSAKVYSDANETLALFGRKPATPKISIAPWDTKITILLTLAYAVVFASAVILCNTRKRRRIATAFFLASAAIHVLYSAATTNAGNRLHGTYINANHFAGYLEIALAFAFGLVWRELLFSRERGAAVSDIGERFEKRALPLAGPILLWAVLAAGIGLTRSRGGILSAALGTIVLLTIAPFHQARSGRRRRMAIGLMVAVFAGILFVGFAVGQAPLLRFLTSDPREVSSDERVAMWRASLAAWHLSPTFGAGLGAFREAFRRTHPASVEGLVEQAHNDFLQMLVTGGWVGATLVTIAFASFFVLLVRAWRRQEHREESAFALAGIGALLMLTLHGLVDFNMSIPANPATLAAMLGIAWSAAVSTGESATTSTTTRPRAVPRTPS